jgi:hypothetical protein
MARGQPKWKKMLNLERAATAAFSSLERRYPRVTSAMGYHAKQGAPAHTTLSSIAHHDLRIAAQPWRTRYEEVKLAQVDLPDATMDPYSVVATTWIVPEVSIPGHTLRLVERATGTVVSPLTDETLRWAKAYPYPLPQHDIYCRGIVYAIPPGERNYYHLLINHLLPFAHAVLRHREEIQGHKLFLVVRDAPSVTQRIADALKFCGFDLEVLQISPSQRIEAELGLSACTYHPSTHPSHGHWTGPEGAELTAALDRIVPAMNTPAKVHVPRTETTVRKIKNNDDVLRCLDNNGFKPIQASWSNFDLQYRTFRQAREAVAVHGAGLTNVCWMEPGSRATEITPTNARRSHFLQIGAERDLDYRFFFAGAEVKKQNFEVDVGALDALLKSG